MTKKYSYNLNKRQIEVNGHYFALCSVADHGNIVRMLNHYEKENEWLKFKLKECQEYKLYSRRELEKENEQLKQQNADWETSFDKCKHYKEAYGTEIVKIKQTIKDMIKTERTELGRSVLKQLWEAIQ